MFHIQSIRIHWWGISVAKKYKLSSSVDGQTWSDELTQSQAVRDGQQYNGFHNLPGWQRSTRFVRVTLEQGTLDPWGLNKRFGLRQFEVTGSLDASQVDAVRRSELGNPTILLAKLISRALTPASGPTESAWRNAMISHLSEPLLQKQSVDIEWWRTALRQGKRIEPSRVVRVRFDFNFFFIFQ